VRWSEPTVVLLQQESNNRLNDAMADQVIKLLRSTYADFGPTLAADNLKTKHGIDLAQETVRQLQIAVGLWIPRKLRPPKMQRPPHPACMDICTYTRYHMLK
jgi:hypothetical protein